MSADRGGLRVELFDGPRVEGPDGPIALSPFQAALVGIVFAERSVSRERVARILWRRDPDAKIRQRIRQLVHAVKTRTGDDILTARGDLLTPSSHVSSDIEDLAGEIRDGLLGEVIRRFEVQYLSAHLPGVAESFEDWRRLKQERLRTTVLVAAQASWEEATAEEDWARAAVAADAIYRLDPESIEAVSNLIEARGRTGRLRGAEAVYAQFQRGPLRARPGAARVDQVIRRVREALRERQGYVSVPDSPLVGRRGALEQLRPAISDVLSGVFTFALVSGEAGIGKTRVMDAIRQEAILAGVRCLHARPVELERRISLNPMLDAFSEVDVESHLDALGEPWRTVVGKTLPPGMLSEPVGELPAIEDRSLSRRLFDAFSMLLQRLADEEPTAIFIDDFQWADETTIELIQFFQRRWEGARLGVFAAIRPEAIDRRDPVATYVSDERGLVTHRADLDELDEADARELLTNASSGAMSPRAQSRLLEIAGRHPLYLIELTREYLVGHFQFLDSSGPELAIPVSLRQILASRSSRLSKDGSAVAAALAVGSRAMTLADLSSVLGLSADTCADAAEELRTNRLAEVDRDRVWMVHDLFRSALYSDLSETRKALLHRRFAEYLLAEGGDASEGELATHFERAGEASQAVRYGWLAGERAMANGAMAEAAYFFEMVARRETDPLRRAEAGAKRADALYLGRDIARANPALELAAASLREVGRLGEARRLEIKRIECLSELGGQPFPELVRGLHAIRRESALRADWETVALCLDAELPLRHGTGDLSTIRHLFREMEVVAEAGSPEAAAVAQMGLAMQVLFGDPRLGLQAARKAVELTEALPAYRLKALLRLAAALQLRGRVSLNEMADTVKEARRLAATSGDIRIRFSIESNVAVGLLDAGELDQAEAMLSRSTELLGNAEMHLARFNQSNNHAELSLARGDFEGARQWFTDAERYLGPATPPYAQQVVVAGLGLCALESGDLAEARRREDSLDAIEVPLYYDPSTLVAFKVRLLELRNDRPIALALLDEMARDLEGRLELAWLKINGLRLEKQLKWGDLDGALPLAHACLTLAMELRLDRRVTQFERVLARLA